MIFKLTKMENWKIVKFLLFTFFYALFDTLRILSNSLTLWLIVVSHLFVRELGWFWREVEAVEDFWYDMWYGVIGPIGLDCKMWLIKSSWKSTHQNKMRIFISQKLIDYYIISDCMHVNFISSDSMKSIETSFSRINQLYEKLNSRRALFNLPNLARFQTFHCVKFSTVFVFILIPPTTTHRSSVAVFSFLITRNHAINPNFLIQLIHLNFSSRPFSHQKIYLKSHFHPHNLNFNDTGIESCSERRTSNSSSRKREEEI